MKSTICHDRLGTNVRNTQESYRSQRGDGPDLVLLCGANERKKLNLRHALMMFVSTNER
jgi:hypothetical protein